MFKKIVILFSKLFGFGANLTDPKQFDIKQEKRYLYRIEAAMNYVFVDEGSGQYKDLSIRKKSEFKKHFRKRIFDIT